MARLSPWTRLSGWMLDGSIVASFDASGFRRHSRDFKDPGIAVDLSGRLCLVTGANDPGWDFPRPLSWPVGR